MKTVAIFVLGCECSSWSLLTFRDQQLEPSKTYLVYLHPWERHITYVEDNRIREVALDGPEASARAKAV